MKALFLFATLLPFSSKDFHSFNKATLVQEGEIVSSHVDSITGRKVWTASMSGRRIHYTTVSFIMGNEKPILITTLYYNRSEEVKGIIL